jgi:hypothetical protein
LRVRSGDRQQQHAHGGGADQPDHNGGFLTG